MGKIYYNGSKLTCLPAVYALADRSFALFLREDLMQKEEGSLREEALQPEEDFLREDDGQAVQGLNPYSQYIVSGEENEWVVKTLTQEAFHSIIQPLLEETFTA